MDRKQTEERVRELERVIGILKRKGFQVQDKFGLKKSEKFTLMLIAEMSKDQPVITSELAKKIGVTLGAVTHQINALEELGFVTRSGSDDDRRIIFITLTAKGKKMAEKIKKIHAEKLRGLIEHLGDGDSRTLISLISKIADYFKIEK